MIRCLEEKTFLYMYSLTYPLNVSSCYFEGLHRVMGDDEIKSYAVYDPNTLVRAETYEQP